MEGFESEGTFRKLLSPTTSAIEQGRVSLDEVAQTSIQPDLEHFQFLNYMSECVVRAWPWLLQRDNVMVSCHAGCSSQASADESSEGLFLKDWVLAFDSLSLAS